MNEMQLKAIEELEQLKQLESYVGKRVEIEATQSQDFFTSKRTVRGWVYKKADDHFYLIPRRNSTSGYFLTFGLFNGLKATLTVQSIKAI